MSQHVRDKVVAPVVAPTTEGNLAQTVVVNAREVPDKVVFSTRSGSGWQDVTATRVRRRRQPAREGPHRRGGRGG